MNNIVCIKNTRDQKMYAVKAVLFCLNVTKRYDQKNTSVQN